MNTHVRTRFSRAVIGSAAAVLAATMLASGWGQQPANNSGNQETPREKAKAVEKEKINAAKEAKQGAREQTREAREGARETARDDRHASQNARTEARGTVREERQTTRDAKAGARDTVREDRASIREARRDVRAARREFIASRIRSGDLGLWLRRAVGGGLTIADVNNRGAIAQSGLNEGDEILAINGQPVTSEREFVDKLFANQDSNQPVQVKIKRNGQEQMISIQPKVFVEEHLANDDRLHEYGIILDESSPGHPRVKAVVPQSPAFYAGLRSGDQITGFQGQRVAAVRDLVQSIINAAGGSAQMEVNRNNQTRQLDIEIPDEHPADQPRTALRPTLPDQPTPAPLPAPVPQTQPRLQPRP
jgi:C-terminal processing protease CtpA/Prc